MRQRLTFIVTSLSVALALGVATAGAQDREEVTMVFAHSKLSTYYNAAIAEELGYFEEEGIDIDLQPTRGGNYAAQQVISGAAEIGLPTQGAVINALSQGHDLVGVYTYRYGGIFSLIVHSSSDAQALEDFENKTVGVSDLGGGEAPLVRGMLAVTGLIPGENVELLPVGEGSPATVRAIRNGEVAAYASSAPDMVALEQLGLKFRRIPFRGQTGFEQDIVVVTPETLAENRDMVVGICRALAKGQYFAHTSLDAAETVMREVLPEEFTSDPDFARAILEEMFRLSQAPESVQASSDGDLEFGRNIPEHWENYQDLLFAASEVAKDETERAIASRVDVNAFLTNDLIDDINDFDRQAVRDRALRIEAEGL